jgi:hypothetical protein
MAMVGEAEAVQIWNADVGALMLHPGMRSHLKAQFLIHRARVLGLSKLVWHRTSKDELLVAAGRSYLDGYADVEAATDPSSPWSNNTGVSITEPQMVLNKCLNGLSLVPECLTELRRGLEVCCLADDIRIFLKCRLVRDGFPVI